MMISPEGFYEYNLKGKSATEIIKVIGQLKREIGRLKNIMEHPEYEQTICPSEDVQIYCTREYLKMAKQVLADMGEAYSHSAAEKEAMVFDENIPYISKIVFSIGGCFGGYETRTFTIDGDKVHPYIEHSLIYQPTNFDDSEIEVMDKEEFWSYLKICNR